MKPVSETHSWWPSSELAVVPLCRWTSIRKVTGFSTNSKLFIKNILYIDVGILFPVDRVFHVWRLGRRGAESKQEKVDMEMFKPPKFLSCLPSGTHGLIFPLPPESVFSSHSLFFKGRLWKKLHLYNRNKLVVESALQTGVYAAQWTILTSTIWSFLSRWIQSYKALLQGASWDSASLRCWVGAPGTA